MASKAVVLSGGGGTGVAWEIGFVAGLRNAKLSLNDADLIVGSSAGAMVGAQIRLGRNFIQLYQAQVQIAALGGPSPVRIQDEAVVTALAEILNSGVELTEEVRLRLGKLAREAKAGAPEDFVATITKALGEKWPDKALKTTAVDAEDASIHAFDGDAGVPLGRAVAISMCVPGMVEPIPAGERRYMDGAMNGLNLHLAEGYDRVFILATRDDGRAESGIARLSAAGAQVLYVPPDRKSQHSLGETNAERFSVARRGPAAEAGYDQAALVAPLLAELWAD